MFLSAQEQRLIVLQSLRLGPMTTDQLRALGVFSPAARVSELKEKGFIIKTYWVTVQDRDGYNRRMGQYCLFPFKSTYLVAA